MLSLRTVFFEVKHGFMESPPPAPSKGGHRNIIKQYKHSNLHQLMHRAMPLQNV